MEISKKLKIAAIILTCCGVALITIGIITIATYTENMSQGLFLTGCILGFAGGGLALFTSIPLWILSRISKIQKALISIQKESLDENKDTIKDLAKTTIDIKAPINEYAIDKNESNIKKV